MPLLHLLSPTDSCWSCFGHWRFIDEYDIVLDLNVLVVHNLQQEEVESLEDDLIETPNSQELEREAAQPSGKVFDQLR